MSRDHILASFFLGELIAYTLVRRFPRPITMRGFATFAEIAEETR